MADKVVLLEVKTHETLKQDTIDQYCDFFQKEGTNEKFTIGVRSGTTIKWQGVPSEQDLREVKVNIQKIQYSGEKNIFGTQFILGKPDTSDSGELLPLFGNIVSGLVPIDVGEETEEYTIYFTVSNQPGIFSIDPIIKVNSNDQ